MEERHDKKHQTCTPTGFRQTGFSQSAMETTDTPHDAWMTKARKVYFSANRASDCGDEVVLRTSRAPQKKDQGEIHGVLSDMIQRVHLDCSKLALSQCWYVRFDSIFGRILIFNIIFNTNSPEMLCAL